MSDVFISYARSTSAQAKAVAETLQALGYSVWRDDDLPAHRSYADVIDERLRAAKAVVVIWSAEAVKSQWVQSEADLARAENKLVQLAIDGSKLPMPFDRIQCADLTGWTGDVEALGWRKVVASIAELTGSGLGTAVKPSPAVTSSQVAESPLPLPSKPSIAVMPFANLSGDPEQDYFADGMVVEIATALSRFRSLFVIGSASSLTYRGTTRSHSDIARELGVRYLLEGSVRRSTDRVRIAVELFDAIANRSEWSERFDGKLDDVFELQDSVANGVAAQLTRHVETTEARHSRNRPTQDLGAYDLYLQALDLWDDLDRETLFKALVLLDEAIARDPRFAPALALAGELRGNAAIWGYVDSPDETMKTGLALVRRALQVDDNDADVVATAAWAINDGGDGVTALALAERAIALNPGSPVVWWRSGWINVYAGQQEVGQAHLKTALRLNPKSRSRWLILTGMGWSLLFLRRYEEAVPLMKEVGEIRPGFEGPAVCLTACYGYLGRLAEAKAVLATVRPDTIDAMFGFFRNTEQQEIIRSGLRLAGAEV